MSCAAAWSWGPPGSAHTAFGAEDAALIEADYLLHLFWGDDPEQKTETAWSKLPMTRIGRHRMAKMTPLRTPRLPPQFRHQRWTTKGRG